MHKKNIIIIACISFVFIFLIMGFLKKNSSNKPITFNYPNLDESVTYEKRLFDDNYVHEVNIKISNKDWNDLTTNPLDETKYKVNITIDGKKIENVSIKTKGNSSLKHIAEGPKEGPAAKRFSFKVDFGNYIDGQTYYGLDKLNLNNIYADATYLNDYVSYETFKQLGVPTPLDSFVYIKINNRNFGLYLAVEEIGDSFLKRNKLDGILYKPEKVQRKDKGVSLKYKGTARENYASLFLNAQSEITEADETRIIQSIKELNRQRNIESVVNTEEVIKYFAAHNFLLSYDSYTGKSFHNYFLLEKDGMMTMLPWDYNLAFGRFNMLMDTTEIVNYGIDSPLNSPNEVIPNEDRPMWNWILQNPDYLNKYHEAMNDLITKYYESGKYEERINEIVKIIAEYRNSDMSSFYTITETKKGIETLKNFCKKRSQSIRLQLNGELSTITDNQDKTKRIDASDIDLNDMGLVADDRMRNSTTTPTPPERGSR